MDRSIVMVGRASMPPDSARRFGCNPAGEAFIQPALKDLGRSHMHTQYTIFLLTVCLLSLPLTGRAQSSIRIGDVHQGSLTPSDKRIDEDGSHYDWYVLKARSGQRVLIELKSDDFDPYLVLLDRDGAEIRSNSGVRTNRSARIELTLPYTEKYHIRVNSLHKDGLGDYTLTIKGAS